MNLRRAAIATLAMIWVCALWPALVEGGDSLTSTLTNLVLFTLLVGIVAWVVRRRRRRK